MLKHLAQLCLLSASALILSACDWSSDDPNVTTDYTVGGTITGANSAILVINDTGGNPDSVSTDASFSFSGQPQSGACYTRGCAYAVEIANQPSGQVCSIANAAGTIGSSSVTDIAVTCTSSPESIAYSFTGGVDGGQPVSGLSKGFDGNFYGVSARGGDYGFGSFYQFNPSTEQTTGLYSFGVTATDGRTPQSGLTQACDGDWYAATSAGGANGSGTFYKITSAGEERVLYSFGATPADAAKPQGLTIDITSCPNPTPTFYGTSTSGGDNGAGTIFSLAFDGVNWTEKVLHSFGAAETDGAIPVAGMARGEGVTTGKYYGTTKNGGDWGYGTFFEYDASTLQITRLHSFGATAADGRYPNQKPRQGDDGNLYGTTSAGGSNELGVIYKIVPSSGAETVLYTFQGGVSDGARPSSRLKIGADGNLYGLTSAGGYFDKGTFYQITPDGVETTLYSFAGAGSSDGAIPNASLLREVNGVWWGTTVSGGASGQGSIFSISVAP